MDTTALAERLAQEIRRVDGSHSLGAAALAEALVPFVESLRAILSEQPGSSVQGEADEAAMEAWHSAVEEAGELYVNAPDSRYANRARRVKAWIVSHRPRVHRSGN